MKTKEEVLQSLIDLEISMQEARKEYADVWGKSHQEAIASCEQEKMHLLEKLQILIELDTLEHRKKSLINKLNPIGHRLTVTGTITKVDHGPSETGDHFGYFVLETVGGDQAFSLRGEDYLKFKNFMNVGWHVIIEGDITDNDVTIRNMDLLHEYEKKIAYAINEDMPF